MSKKQKKDEKPDETPYQRPPESASVPEIRLSNEDAAKIDKAAKKKVRARDKIRLVFSKIPRDWM